MQNKKKPLRKIILWNILALVMLFALAEAASYVYIFYRFNFGDLAAARKAFKGRLVFPKYDTNKLSPEEWLIRHYKPRQPSFPPANIPWGRPIVTFGCSFTYGIGLEREQTYPYKLTALTGRPVFNVSQEGWGIQHMLYQLKTGLGLDGIYNPEFVIFLFISDHIRRLKSPFGNPPWPTGPYIYNDPPYFTYIEKNGKLEPKKYKFRILANWFTFDQIYDAISGEEIYGKSFLNIRNRPAAKKKIANFMEMHFLESNEEIHKRWPDAKFIIMTYDNYAFAESDQIWLDLQKQGITVFSLVKIANDAGITEYRGNPEYSLPGDTHPNEKFWDALTPGIAQKLKEISSETTKN